MNVVTSWAALLATLYRSKHLSVPGSAVLFSSVLPVTCRYMVAPHMDWCSLIASWEPILGEAGLCSALCCIPGAGSSFCQSKDATC